MADDLTKSNDPRLVASRIFIGNLPTDRCTKEEVQDHFCCYGEILGISLFKGFGFVQFKEIGDAQHAVEREHQAPFKGNLLDIRLASEGRKPKPAVAYAKRPYDNRDQHYRPPSREFRTADSFDRASGSGPPPAFYPPPSGSFGAAGMPPMENFVGGPAPPNPTAFHYSLPPQEPPRYEQYRPEPMMGGASLAPMARPPPGLPLQSAKTPAASPPPIKKLKSEIIERPSDATVVVFDKKYLAYAEMVERRLIEMNLSVDVVILVRPELSTRTLDALARKGGLYAVVIDEQHFEHQSVSVNVMHGTPQEHRNMPLDDALQMLSRDFGAYLNKLRAGAEQPSLSFLLHLLADGKSMSEAEIERIIDHLRQRSNRERDSNAKDMTTSDPSSTVAPMAVSGRSPAVNNSVAYSSSPTPFRAIIKQEPLPAQQPTAARAPVQSSKQSHGELQQKILSILSGGSSANALSSASFVPQNQQPMATVASSAASSAPPPQPSSLGGSAQSSGLAGNPELQKTLQTILSNPMLRNLLPVVSQQQQQPHQEQAYQQYSSTKMPTGQSSFENGRGMSTGDSSLQPSYVGSAGGAAAFGMAHQFQQKQQNVGSQQQVNGSHQYHQQFMPPSGNQYQQTNAAGNQQQGVGVGQFGQQMPPGGPFARVDTANLPGAQGGYYRQPPPSGGNRGLLG